MPVRGAHHTALRACAQGVRRRTRAIYICIRCAAAHHCVIYCAARRRNVVHANTYMCSRCADSLPVTGPQPLCYWYSALLLVMMCCCHCEHDQHFRVTAQLPYMEYLVDMAEAYTAPVLRTAVIIAVHCHQQWHVSAPAASVTPVV